MISMRMYYKVLEKERRKKLLSIHNLILKLYPRTVVSMRYKMPTFEVNEKWMSIGNQKHHIAVYTCDKKYIESYITKHPQISSGKGCIRFKDTDKIVMVDMQELIRITLG